jgi:DNA-binding IclR family transcriptional regulator
MAEKHMEEIISRRGSTYNPIVPAVDQASRLLVYLAKNPVPRASLTDICRDLGIHKSKGFSILHTLRKYRFVEKDPESKTYFLGPGLLPLSRKVLDNVDLRSMVAPYLDTLARETKSTALLGLVSGDHVFVVAKKQGNLDVAVTIAIGHRLRVTAGAHGKAIVAFMSPSEREKILNRKGLYFHGEPESLNRERLIEELDRCRKAGYAKDLGGLLPGINAISSPIIDANGRVLGCVILIGTFGKSFIDRYGQSLARSTREISSKLGSGSD